MKALFSAVCFLSLAACVHHSKTKTASLTKIQAIRDFSVGPWENPFRGNPELAGVDVQQFGECPYDQHSYEGRHPCEIYFYFWDGRVRQRGYEPDGRLREDFWWPEGMRLKPRDSGWNRVDFSHGSDPTFKRHADPRI